MYLLICDGNIATVGTIVLRRILNLIQNLDAQKWEYLMESCNRHKFSSAESIVTTFLLLSQTRLLKIKKNIKFYYKIPNMLAMMYALIQSVTADNNWL